ncbi:MAG TPA: hypothetical protein ENK18_08325 [Deltaproteobacteria bacterium]|nr:hypothetical protein [Deltaproteobacteria bacterium]
MPADPLWRQPAAPVPPADAVAVVHAFLHRCRAWGAEREIPALLEALQLDAGPEPAARLHQWATWVAFLDHALAELESGALDRWFESTDTL